MGKRMNDRIGEAQLPYAHWLYGIPGIGSRTISHLLQQVKTPEAVYQLSGEELENILPPAKRKLADRIVSSKQNWQVDTAYEKLAEKQIRFTCLGHDAYPERLSRIPDAPFGIYYIGRLPEKRKPSVALIGARSCSAYGKQMAERFGSELARADVEIISGMARGIDGIGQKAALQADGYSLGVLGCGVDICYPSENRDLYDMLCAYGGVCSEYLPGTAPQNRLFPPRNRIISALADIVLVIEAKRKSGTLITVDMALEQGKEVYALPGRVTEALSEGCNYLLKQGAGIAISPRDMLQDMYQNRLFSLSEVQQEILNLLEHAPHPAVWIKERMLLRYEKDIPIPELMNQLVELSLQGVISSFGNSYFAK